MIVSTDWVMMYTSLNHQLLQLLLKVMMKPWIQHNQHQLILQILLVKIIMGPYAPTWKWKWHGIIGIFLMWTWKLHGMIEPIVWIVSPSLRSLFKYPMVGIALNYMNRCFSWLIWNGAIYTVCLEEWYYLIGIM